MFILDQHNIVDNPPAPLLADSAERGAGGNGDGRYAMPVYLLPSRCRPANIITGITGLFSRKNEDKTESLSVEIGRYLASLLLKGKVCLHSIYIT